ncbi:MAG: DUF488 domain-containing protein [Burkholderiales bacterium]|nr:DUF488 domain-containing protein [Anaerolineae bacterium]
MSIRLFTIGFTEKTAEQFFGLLREAGVQVLVDTRLKPDTQLSGFAKRRDLPYLLRNLINCDYIYMGQMSPTAALLDQYRKDHLWDSYEIGFNQLLRERDLISHLERDWWTAHRTCLLCSEHKPDECHRRLVAEYIAQHWPETEIHHLM